MLRHYPYSLCDRKIANKCHCLLVESAEFYVCCGWYCERCSSRVEDMRKIDHAVRHYHPAELRR